MKPVSHFHLGSPRTETYIVVISLPSCVPSVCVSRISGQSPLNALCDHILYAFFSFDARCVLSNAWIQPFCFYKCSHCAFLLMHFDAFWLEHWLLMCLAPNNSELLKCRDVNISNCGISPMQSLQCCGTSALSLMPSWTQLSSVFFFPSGSLSTVAVSAFLVWLYYSTYLHQRPDFDEAEKKLAIFFWTLWISRGCCWVEMQKILSSRLSACDLFSWIILCLAFVSDQTR